MLQIHDSRAKVAGIRRPSHPLEYSAADGGRVWGSTGGT